MYSGKSIDGFEYALNSLLMKNNYSPLAHIDCISYRCFSENGSLTDLSTFLLPTLHWNEYLAILNRNLNSPIGLEYYSADKFDFSKFNKTWVLIGELTISRCEETIRSHFHNSPAFLLCRKHSDMSYEICNPLGCHSYYLYDANMTAILKESNGFVLFLPQCSFQPKPDYAKIAKEALEWRIKNRNTLFIEQNIARTVHTLLTKDKISLQYALQNYCIQLQKIMKFFSEYGNCQYNIHTTASICTSVMNSVQDGSFDGLNSRLQDFWNSLYTAGGNDNVVSNQMG